MKLAARVACVLLALLSMAWAFRFVPTLAESRASGLEAVGRRLVILDVFEPEFLDALDAASVERLTAGPCLPKDLESLVLVRAAAAGPALVGLEGADQLAVRIQGIEDAARLSLRCNPHSSMSWTLLAWANMFKDERDVRKILRYTDMSYLTGPREFATVVRRIEVWLQLWDDLDAAHKAGVGDQVNLLAKSRQYSIMAFFYLSANTDAKAYLEERFGELDEAGQNAVARFVRAEDGDIALPLVAPEGERPWR